MPAICIAGSPLTTGHLCSTVSILAVPLQTKVFAMGSLVAVAGTPVAAHTILVGDDCVPHVAILNTGSIKVKAGGLPVGRVFDSADGGIMTAGLPNITVG
tara:strand:- start:8286 stop:8585 length:300 start_codon:yes stop_codon:yes gene_type:complete